MKTWLLYLLTLNAQTGDLIDSHPEGSAMLAEDCLKAMTEKGPQVVKDGKATVYVCYNTAQQTTSTRI
jgi:hypothetical protein